MTTTRCTPAERKAILLHSKACHRGASVAEPALGTLAQRLDILVKRHGGNVRMPRPTTAESRDYLRWLKREGLDS